MLANNLLRLASLCPLLLAFSLAPATCAQDAVPAGVDAEDWATVRTLYDAGQHAASATEEGFEARNPGQGWQLRFDGRGFCAQPDHGGWSWGLELVRYGFTGRELEVGEEACASAEGGRVAYRWDDTLEEWYINDKRGLEHGYTVHERPRDSVESGESPLALTLRVRGGLTPSVQADQRGVRFSNANGATALTYSGLHVFDADARVLPAWFEPGAETGQLKIVIEERGARYPLTIDPIAQQAYLKASNTQGGAQFGSTVAIFGDTLVVGSPAFDVAGDQTAGAVYVFIRTGSSWSQQAFLTASNPDEDDRFGGALVIQGDTLVVSAVREDSSATGSGGDQADNGAGNSGAVYVFARSGTTWTQQAYLKASNTGLGDLFGLNLDLSGDTLVVGASGESSNATGVNGDQANNGAAFSGAAYVFTRSGTSWTQEAYLKASNTGAVDFFGVFVALEGDTLAVGANNEDSSATGIDGDQASNSATNSGAVYVFVRNGTTWSQEAYIKASNTDAGDFFGGVGALSGETLIVTARGEDSGATGINGNQADSSGTQSGAAYIFVRNGTTWSQQAYMKASNTEPMDRFGEAVDIFGDTAVVSAVFEDGADVGVNGDQSNDNVFNSGAAYAFARSGTTWSQVAYLKASNTAGTDRFGSAVAISDNTVVVGAADEDSNATGVGGEQTNDNAGDSGAVFVFDLAFDPSGPPVGIDRCNGDGGDQLGCTDCPCMNNSPIGTVGGCLNSTATSSRLHATGDISVSAPSGIAADLRFSVSAAPPTAFAILFSGDALAPTDIMNPCFGLNTGVQAATLDGLRCAAMNTRRYGNRFVNSNGQVGMDGDPWGGENLPIAGIAQTGGGSVAGQTRYFQIIHRDNMQLSCMRGLNTSQAIEITFTP